MAVIGSIRKRSSLLVIIIGVALAAFVLGDFARGGRMGNQEVNIGIVEGEEITYQEFSYKLDQNIQATKQQQQKERLTPDETFSLQNETWNQMVGNVLLQKEYEALGLEVTVEELDDLIRGANPHQLIIQSFTNPQTGMFDRNSVDQFIASLDRQSPETQQQWIIFEEYIKNDRLRIKYNTLISKGYHVPVLLAKLAYENENNKSSIEFISRKFVDVSDSLISPTDDDYERQYEIHKEQYKQDAFRVFDYVIFNIDPSDKDLEAARTEMNIIYDEFQLSEDPARFVLVNSDVNYDSSWKAEGTLPVEIDSIMFNSEIGTVVEPYIVNNTYYIARLMDIAQRPDSLRASHILISYQGAAQAMPEVSITKVQAELLADSLKNVLVASPGRFVELAKVYSNDPMVSGNDGDLNWFEDGRMMPEFNETVINNKIGSINLAETPYGYHIIIVTGKKDLSKKVRVGIVESEVIPSNETYQHLYAQASKLASESRSVEDFDAAVNEEGFNKRTSNNIKEINNRITGLNSPRQIIRWAFGRNLQVGEVEVGDVSNVFDLDGQFVVAVLTKKAEEGYPQMDEVKKRLKNFVNNDLKGKLIVEEMNGMDDDFDKLTEAGFNKSDMASITFDSRNIIGFGTESEVIGTIFGKMEGDQFGPVVGKGGVFLVKVGNTTLASEQASYLTTINKLQKAYETRVGQGFAFKALENTSDIEDNRISFY